MVDERASSGTAAYDSDATVGIDDLSGDSDDIVSPISILAGSRNSIDFFLH